MIPGADGERGATLVEFGLSAMMLMLLVLGVVEISRMLLIYNTVANAAREGVRYAQTQSGPAVAATQQNVIQVVLSGAPVDLANASSSVNYQGTSGSGVACTNANATAGCTVVVTVNYLYNPFVTFYSRFFSLNISSTSEGIMTW